jgi:hypothetical protein
MDVDNVDKVSVSIIVLGIEGDYLNKQKLQTMEMLECNFDPLLHSPVRQRHNFQCPNLRAQKQSIWNLNFEILLCPTIDND